MTKKGKELKEDYQWQIKSQYKGEVLTEALEMACTLFFPDKRRRDIDNYNKLLLDAFEGIVYKDDSQIQRLVLEKEYDKKDPRIHIEIHRL